MFKLLYVFITCFFSFINVTAHQSHNAIQTTQTRPKLVSTALAPFYEANLAFDAIDFPLNDIQDLFTKNLFENIDATFGTQGLGLTNKQVTLIKKTYLYLIFLTKINLVKTNPMYKKYENDFTSFLQDNNTTLPHIPSKTLVTSAGWNNVVVTEQELQDSLIWQLFCKSTVTDSYTFFYKALEIIHEVEQQTFNYIPHIETSFYDQDYTNMRHINELIRIKIILEQKKQQHFLQQIHQWKKLPLVNPQNQQENKKSTLEYAILLFKKTDFYKNTHNMYHLLGIPEQDGQTISTQHLMSPQQLPSPLKEHVWCCFMLQEIATLLNNQITTDKLHEVLQHCSDSKVKPSLFIYNQDDYNYFEEMLAIKSKSEGTHTLSVHPSPDQYKKEDVHVPIAMAHDLHRASQKAKKQNIIQKQTITNSSVQNVIQQNIFSDIGHFFTNVAKTVKHGLEDVAQGIKHAAEAVGYGAASLAEGAFGFATSIIGNILNISEVRKFGDKVEKDAYINMRKTTTELQKTVDNITEFAGDFTQAGLDMTVGLASELSSIIIDDEQLGEDFNTMMNQTVNTLATIGAKLTDVAIEGVNDVMLTTFQVGMKFANVVTAAAIVMFTGGQFGINELEADGKDLLKTTVNSIVLSFDNLMSQGKDLLHAVVTGLGAIINSLTTIFINISKEVTYIAAAAWDLAKTTATGDFDYSKALNDAKETRNMVKNKLQEHRQTINQVMGVAVSLAFTIATMGAGAEAGAGVEAAEATDAALDATLDISEEAGEQTSEQSAEQGAEQGSEQSAKQTTQQSNNEPEPQEQSKSDTSDNENQNEQKNDDDTTNENDKDNDNKNDKDEDSTSKDKTNFRKYLTPKNVLAGVNLAVNAVFGAFNIMAGLNSDDQNELKEQQQAEHLMNFWKYINDQKISTIQQESAYLQETELQQQAAIGNSILSLGFIRNTTFAQVNQVSQQIAQNLAKNFIIPLLKPNSNNMRLANIGTSWGLETNYLNLYPTEGYSTATTGRTDFPFAQEVAQVPYTGSVLSKTSSTNLSGKQKGANKMWFNQKVLALDKAHRNGTTKKPLDPLQVAIDLQFIYTLNAPFYVGLYLGGAYHDYTSSTYLQKLQKTETFDLDYANLAKMVVLFRDSAKSVIKIGVYENEGNDWIIQETLPSSMQFTDHHIYHLEAELNQDALAIKLWVDNDTKNVWSKQVAVEKITNQRTYGVISSGAAIEWNQRLPQPTLVPNVQARQPLQTTSEIAREKKSKVKTAQLLQPHFGSFTLQPISKQAILFGQYLYSTKDTNITKVTNKNGIDYVLFATNRNGSISNYGTAPTTVDNKPSDNPNVLVSVITGNVYDNTGNVVAHTSNLWNEYKKKHGPFNPTVDTYITTTQQALLQNLKNITFGSFDLDIISQTALNNDQFVYSCDQTINLKDSNGQQIIDYVIMAEISNNKLGRNIGMPPTAANAQGILSLVTGNLYAKTTTSDVKPIAQHYAELYVYEGKFNALAPQDLAAIQKSQQAYQAASTSKPQQAKKTQSNVTVISSHSANSGTISLSNTGISLSGDNQISLNTEPTNKGNIISLQKTAAGSAGFQFPVNQPAGPSIKL